MYASFVYSPTIIVFAKTNKVHDDIGRGNFLAIYFSSGVLASFISLGSFVLRNQFYTSSLGASGAIAGVLAAWCTINSEYVDPFRPETTTLLTVVHSKYFSFIFLPPGFLPPLSSSILLSVLIAVELAGISRGWRRLDHWAHLGGYVAGFGGAQVLKYRAKERKRLEAQRRSNLGLLDRVREGRL